MNEFDLVTAVVKELFDAEKKHSDWPDDPLHALAILTEEFGELGAELLRLVYEPEKATKENALKEAIQVAAMAIRVALSIERYEYAPSPAHKQ